MKSLLLILFTLISSSLISFSQFIGQQPIEKKGLEEDVVKRDEFLYAIRMFPVESIAPDAMTKALMKRNINRSRYSTPNDFTPWVSLGPTPGPNYSGVGSRTTVVRFNPTNSNEIYIAASDGGVWKSTDAGQNFVPKTDFQPSLSSGAMEIYQGFAVNPTIFYGTGEGGFGHVYEYYGQGLLISYDGGDNWTQVLNGLPYNSYFYKIAINPANPNIILAGLGTGYANTVYSGGLYRSTDFGSSWVRVIPASLGDNGLTCSDIVFSPDGTKAYIIGPDNYGTPRPWENGVSYRMSTDGGMTFFAFRQNPIPSALQLAIAKSSPNILYAYAVLSECGVKLYKSVNYGYNWSEIPNPTNYSYDCCPQFGYNMVLKVDPNNANLVYMGGRYLYKTTNDGANWTPISAPHMDHHDLDIDPNNSDHLLVGCDGGVYQSFNGGASWNNLNATITTLGLYSISSDPTEYYHMIAGAQDNNCQYRPNSNQPPNQTWYSAGWGDGTSAYIDKNDPTKTLGQMSAYSVGLAYSTNGGASYWDVNGLYPAYGYPWIPAITDDPNNPGRYYTGRYEVFRSDDYGVNWYTVSDQGNMHGYDKVHNIAVSPVDPNLLYATVGTFEYYPPDVYYQGIFKSTNGGVTWTNLNVTENSQIPTRFMSNILVESNGDVVVSLSGFGTRHMYKSTNGGSNWFIIDPYFGEPGLPDVPVNDFIIYQSEEDSKYYIAATDIGVFYSDGISGDWYEIYDGMPNNVVMDIEKYGTMLRVATLGRGAWEMNFASMDDKLKKTQAYNYSLKDNYPNPFNPSTNISFTLAKNENVKIIIYDITGREIKTLINEFKNKGEYTVKFDGTNLASGLYFYKLVTDNFTETKKMLLVK